MPILAVCLRIFTNILRFIVNFNNGENSIVDHIKVIGFHPFRNQGQAFIVFNLLEYDQGFPVIILCEEKFPDILQYANIINPLPEKLGFVNGQRKLKDIIKFTSERMKLIKSVQIMKILGYDNPGLGIGIDQLIVKRHFVHGLQLHVKQFHHCGFLKSRHVSDIQTK